MSPDHPAESVAIRKADAADALELAEFAARLFRETYGSSTPAADLDAYVAANFGREIQAGEIGRSSDAVFLAISADDHIVGYAHVLAQADALLLNRIYVDLAVRGTGVSRRLFEAVVSECRRRRATRLVLTVFEKNARARAFYRRLGFREIGMTPFMVGSETQIDVEMEYDVTP